MHLQAIPRLTGRQYRRGHSLSWLGLPGVWQRRTFRTSPCWDIKTTDLSEKELSSIKVNRERLWRELHGTCEWGKGERWGA